MTFYPLFDILGVFSDSSYHGVVRLESGAGRVIYLVFTNNRQVGFICQYTPQNEQVVRELVAITGQSNFQALSPRQFLAKGLESKAFTREEFDAHLTRYLLTQLSEFLSQQFRVDLCHDVFIDMDWGIPIRHLLDRLVSTEQLPGMSSPLAAKTDKELTLADLVCFPVIQGKVNDRVYLYRLQTSDQNAKLLGMGFTPGVEMLVINTLPDGGVIVGLREERVGIGAEVAGQVLVIKAEDWQKIRSMMNPQEVKLGQAPIGSRLRVVGYAATGREYKQKLLAMGLTPGVEIVVKRHAPLGDPTEIEVRGFALSLRKDEAAALRVVLIQGGEP
ncbi:MAG: FeoA family protein [Pseudanabaenaceae cyanobacterium SKYGB_i_bin29]|nr:ferrous iron transport protein A [Pseudanabaenaceae cyanobacterium SKYG29]MDW8422616.1 FeoA family protein [Pseudanabaenaceae cyanobacterium SKYGB_i_bin29]